MGCATDDAVVVVVVAVAIIAANYSLAMNVER